MRTEQVMNKVKAVGMQDKVSARPFGDLIIYAMASVVCIFCIYCGVLDKLNIRILGYPHSWTPNG